MRAWGSVGARTETTIIFKGPRHHLLLLPTPIHHLSSYLSLSLSLSLSLFEFQITKTKARSSLSVCLSLFEFQIVFIFHLLLFISSPTSLSVYPSLGFPKRVHRINESEPLVASHFVKWQRRGTWGYLETKRAATTSSRRATTLPPPSA